MAATGLGVGGGGGTITGLGGGGGGATTGREGGASGPDLVPGTVRTVPVTANFGVLPKRAMIAALAAGVICGRSVAKNVRFAARLTTAGGSSRATAVAGCATDLADPAAMASGTARIEAKPETGFPAATDTTRQFTG